MVVRHRGRIDAGHRCAVGIAIRPASSQRLTPSGSKPGRRTEGRWHDADVTGTRGNIDLDTAKLQTLVGSTDRRVQQRTTNTAPSVVRSDRKQIKTSWHVCAAA